MEENRKTKISIALLSLIIYDVVTIILYLSKFYDKFGRNIKMGFNLPFIIEIIFSYIGIILFNLLYICFRRKRENDNTVNKVMSGVVYSILIIAAILEVLGILLIFTYHD